MQPGTTCPPIGQSVTTRQCGLVQPVLRPGQAVTTRQCGLVQPILRVGHSALSIRSTCTFTLYPVQSVLWILRLLLALNITNVRSVDLWRLIDSLECRFSLSYIPVVDTTIYLHSLNVILTEHRDSLTITPITFDPATNFPAKRLNPHNASFWKNMHIYKILLIYNHIFSSIDLWISNRGILLLLLSITECVKFMLDQGADFISTYNFKQDPLKQHLGHYRHKGGANNNPSVYEVRHTMTQLRAVGA